MDVEALEQVASIVVELLVDREYQAIENLTRGERLTADELRKVIADYRLTLVSAPEYEMDFVEIPGMERPTFDVDVQLCSLEEGGPSDLYLELRLTETPLGIYQTKVMDLRVQ